MISDIRVSFNVWCNVTWLSILKQTEIFFLCNAALKLLLTGQVWFGIRWVESMGHQGSMQQNEISDDFYIQCFENSQIMSVSKLEAGAETRSDKCVWWLNVSGLKINSLFNTRPPGSLAADGFPPATFGTHAVLVPGLQRADNSCSVQAQAF